MSQDLSFKPSLSKWREFIDSFNAEITARRRMKSDPPPHEGLKLIDVNRKDQSWSLALQISSQLEKKYEYYIKIHWNSKGNEYVVSKELMPYGVDVQKLLEGHTLKTFENVVEFVKVVFQCCCAFHDRQDQIHDFKDLVREKHWHVELFFSHTLLYIRLGFHPLDDKKNSPSKERRHIFIELHYEQHRIRPREITFDCKGFSDEEMEDMKFQFSVFKKYTLRAAIEFALVKEEEASENDGSDVSDGHASPVMEPDKICEDQSSSESAVAGPSGTQQQRAKSPSSSYSSS